MGFHAPLWRALAVFRTASMLYAAALVAHFHESLARPWLAWTVLATMAAWTGISSYAYIRCGRRDWTLLLVDLAVTFGCLLSTGLAVTPGYLRLAPPLTATWFAGAALSAAVIGGRRWALGIALGYGAADILLRVIIGADITWATPRGVVLLLLTGYTVGYMAQHMQQAERKFTSAVELEGRLRERERLARSIHDSVLQVLAMVQRRGTEIGGEAAELGQLAGEQEEKLRVLIGAQRAGPVRTSPPTVASSPEQQGGTELCSLLRMHATVTVTVSAPATPVLMSSRSAEEVDAAVQAALANIERHCPTGTRAWLLVEDEDSTVTVTVRDDGPGMPRHRIAEAADEGRLGIAQSIRGRIRDLNGEVTIVTAPGEGTEIEMCLPRSGAREVTHE